MDVFCQHHYLLLIQSNRLCCVYLQRNVLPSNIMFSSGVIAKNNLNLYALKIIFNLHRERIFERCVCSQHMSAVWGLSSTEIVRKIISYFRIIILYLLHVSNASKYVISNAFVNPKAFFLIICPPTGMFEYVFKPYVSSFLYKFVLSLVQLWSFNFEVTWLIPLDNTVLVFNPVCQSVLRNSRLFSNAIFISAILFQPDIFLW